MSSPSSTARFHIQVGSHVTLPPNKGTDAIESDETSGQPPASCGTSLLSYCKQWPAILAHSRVPGSERQGYS